MLLSHLSPAGGARWFLKVQQLLLSSSAGGDRRTLSTAADLNSCCYYLPLLWLHRLACVEQDHLQPAKQLRAGLTALHRNKKDCYILCSVLKRSFFWPVPLKKISLMQNILF